MFSTQAMYVSWTALMTEEVSAIFSFKKLLSRTSPAGQRQWWIITLITFLKYQSYLSSWQRIPNCPEESRPCEYPCWIPNCLLWQFSWSSWLSLESYACCFGFEHHVSLIFSTSHRDKYHKYLLEGLLPLGAQYILGSLSDSGTEGRMKVDSLPYIPSGKRTNKNGKCCFLQLPEASLSCFVENRLMSFLKQSSFPSYEKIIPSSIIELILRLDFLTSQCGPGWTSDFHKSTHNQKWTFTSSIQCLPPTESAVMFLSSAYSKL